LAAIQDWDIVCWHYWGSVGDITTSERPFDKAMDVTTGGHPQGYHYTYDEVQNAIMRGAGYAFRNLHIPPAPEPTTFIYGRRSLYDPASMDYAGSYGKNGLHMLGTTYEHGVRILIDPLREKDEVIGPVVRIDGEGKSPIIRPNDQITFDTQRGGIVFDTPGCAAFTGFMTRFGETVSFPASGVTLSDVSIAVPADMPYPEGIAEERYLSFVLTSAGRESLAQTNRATLSVSSTSFNSGFRLKQDNPKGKNVRGKLPVLTARVGATISASALDGMHYVMRDWHMQSLAEGTIRNGRLRIPSELPVFTIDLTRD
jgi:hypothetical protein